ncbi:MAG: tetratricopeptide repeat protein, partial [Bacteroidota bacterium]
INEDIIPETIIEVETPQHDTESSYITDEDLATQTGGQEIVDSGDQILTEQIINEDIIPETIIEVETPQHDTESSFITDEDLATQTGSQEIVEVLEAEYKPEINTTEDKLLLQEQINIQSESEASQSISSTIEQQVISVENLIVPMDENVISEESDKKTPEFQEIELKQIDSEIKLSLADQVLQKVNEIRKNQNPASTPNIADIILNKYKEQKLVQSVFPKKIVENVPVIEEQQAFIETEKLIVTDQTVFNEKIADSIQTEPDIEEISEEIIPDSSVIPEPDSDVSEYTPVMDFEEIPIPEGLVNDFVSEQSVIENVTEETLVNNELFTEEIKIEETIDTTAGDIENIDKSNVEGGQNDLLISEIATESTVTEDIRDIVGDHDKGNEMADLSYSGIDYFQLFDASEIETDVEIENVPENKLLKPDDTNDGLSFSEWLNVFSNETHKKENIKKEILTNGKNNIIDQFIISNPRITQEQTQHTIKDYQFDNEPVDENFITETLANIYVKQGYYKKAIQAYEKLCLKYPEKIIYFVAQIEKINEFLLNKK